MSSQRSFSPPCQLTLLSDRPGKDGVQRMPVGRMSGRNSSTQAVHSPCRTPLRTWCPFHLPALCCRGTLWEGLSSLPRSSTQSILGRLTCLHQLRSTSQLLSLTFSSSLVKPPTLPPFLFQHIRAFNASFIRSHFSSVHLW